jgi:hypothetical protein
MVFLFFSFAWAKAHAAPGWLSRFRKAERSMFFVARFLSETVCPTDTDKPTFRSPKSSSGPVAERRGKRAVRFRGCSPGLPDSSGSVVMRT